MTAAVFVADAAALQQAVPGSRITVTGPEGRHASAVRRVRTGEPIDLVDGEGTRASGTVSAVLGPSAIEVTVVGVQSEPQPRVRVVVVQALLKGDAMALAFEMLTEVGVDRIVPWQAERSIPRWTGDRADKGQQRLRAVVAAAGKQSRRARFPSLAPLAQSADVAGLLAEAGLALVLHEESEEPLARVLPPDTGDVVLVIGPEGGIAESELVLLRAARASVVRMGPTVLRAQTAGAAAAAVVLARCGRWG